MRSSREGFTLAEVLVATAILTVGVTAAASGLQHAVHAVEASRQQTIALFLAEQRLEQAKALAVTDFDRLTPAAFPAEAPVAGYPQFQRVVEVAANPAGLADAVRVQVTVTYPAFPSAITHTPRQVTLATVLSRRR
jgi:prepilin-type N-terminal cleavage/methylation domain-containing protein